MTTDCYFAIGSTLANMVNVETYLDAPQVLNMGRVPAVGSVKERDLAGILTRTGKINSHWLFDAPTDAGRIAFNAAAFGDQTTASAELYISTLDDTGHYSPYLVVVDRPVEQEDYTLVFGGVYVRALTVNLFNCRVQSLSKSANYTVTTSDHLIYMDTSGGSRTFALPALSGVNPNVVYSFIKTSASNNLVLDPNSTETIDGASTKTVTALNARVDIISNGTQWVSL